MLKIILELLPLVDYGQGECIDIAKGKNAIPKTLNEIKRVAKWQSQK